MSNPKITTPDPSRTQVLSYKPTSSKQSRGYGLIDLLNYFKQGFVSFESKLEKVEEKFSDKILNFEESVKKIGFKSETLISKYRSWFDSDYFKKTYALNWNNIINKDGSINQTIFKKLNEFVEKGLYGIEHEGKQVESFFKGIIGNSTSVEIFLKRFVTRQSIIIYQKLRSNINSVQTEFKTVIGKIGLENIDHLEQYVMLKLKQDIVLDEKTYNFLNLVSKSNQFKNYIEKMNIPEFENLCIKFLEFLDEIPQLKFLFSSKLGLFNIIGGLIELPKIITFPIIILLLLFILISIFYFSEKQFNYIISYFFGFDINDSIINELKQDIKLFLDKVIIRN